MQRIPIVTCSLSSSFYFAPRWSDAAPRGGTARFRAIAIPRPYNDTATSTARPASTTVAGLLFWVCCIRKVCMHAPAAVVLCHVRRFAVPHRAASIPRPYNTATSSARPASTTVAGLLFWLRCMKKLCTSTTPNKGGNFQLTRAWFNPTKTCSRSPQPTGRSSLRFPTRAASFPGVAISPRPRGRRRWNPEKR